MLIGFECQEAQAMKSFMFVLALLVSIPVAAQEVFDPFEPVSAAAMGRFTGGYGDDLALLIEPSSDSDNDYTLVILADAAGPGGSLGEIARYEDAAWGGVGDFYGNRPSVNFTDAGSLQLRSGNDAVGRNRWNQTVTLIWRDNSVILGGYTYIERDTLEQNSEFGCDINLLTGNADVTDAKSTRKMRVDARQMPFARWLELGRPNLCPQP
ncbi:MAG: hypothetical protein AAFR27_00605 [Pseudomonadota bacterium]